MYFFAESQRSFEPKHFANQASIYLIPTFIRDESSASRHDFSQKLAHHLYVTRAIFSMAGHGKTYFQSSTFRWDLHKLAMLLTWRRRLLLKKKIEHIMRYTSTKTGCNEWIIAIECGQNIKVTEGSGKNND